MAKIKWTLFCFIDLCLCLCQHYTVSVTTASFYLTENKKFKSSRFLNKIENIGTTKEKKDKLDFMKIKNFCSLSTTIKKMKRWGTWVTQWVTHLTFFFFKEQTYFNVQSFKKKN